MGNIEHPGQFYTAFGRAENTSIELVPKLTYQIAVVAVDMVENDIIRSGKIFNAEAGLGIDIPFHRLALGEFSHPFIFGGIQIEGISNDDLPVRKDDLIALHGDPADF
jgi:hypothetical protein